MCCCRGSKAGTVLRNRSQKSFSGTVLRNRSQERSLPGVKGELFSFTGGSWSLSPPGGRAAPLPAAFLWRGGHAGGASGVRGQFAGSAVREAEDAPAVRRSPLSVQAHGEHPVGTAAHLSGRHGGGASGGGLAQVWGGQHGLCARSVVVHGSTPEQGESVLAIEPWPESGSSSPLLTSLLHMFAGVYSMLKVFKCVELTLKRDLLLIVWLHYIRLSMRQLK